MAKRERSAANHRLRQFRREHFMCFAGYIQVTSGNLTRHSLKLSKSGKHLSPDHSDRRLVETCLGEALGFLRQGEWLPDAEIIWFLQWGKNVSISQVTDAMQRVLEGLLDPIRQERANRHYQRGFRFLACQPETLLAWKFDDDMLDAAPVIELTELLPLIKWRGAYYFCRSPGGGYEPVNTVAIGPNEYSATGDNDAGIVHSDNEVSMHEVDEKALLKQQISGLATGLQNLEHAEWLALSFKDECRAVVESLTPLVVPTNKEQSATRIGTYLPPGIDAWSPREFYTFFDENCKRLSNADLIVVTQHWLSLQKDEYGSFEANKQMTMGLRKVLKSLGQKLVCTIDAKDGVANPDAHAKNPKAPLPSGAVPCYKPATLACYASPTHEHGVFRFEHSGVPQDKHGWEPNLPLLVLCDPPIDGRVKASAGKRRTSKNA